MQYGWRAAAVLGMAWYAAMQIFEGDIIGNSILGSAMKGESGLKGGPGRPQIL